MKCRIILKLGNATYSFNSNEELDGWLLANKGKLSLRERDVTYSLGAKHELSAMANSEQKETFGRLEAIRRLHDNIKATAKANLTDPSKRKVYASWSEAQKWVGGTKDVNTPANTRKYSDDAEGVFRRQLGHDFEEAFLVALKPGYIGKYTAVKDMPNSIAKLEAVAAQVLERIRELHGKNCEIFTEYEVGTTTIGDSFLNAIHLASGYSQGIGGGTNEEVNSFVGKIDLLVIDDKGVAHIYDFKTAGVDHNVTRDPHYAKQIGIYRQMVRQGDVQTGSVALIPIHVDFASKFVNDDTFIENVSFNKDAISDLGDGEISRVVRNWFPDNLQVKFEELTQTNKVLKEFAPGSDLDAQTKFKEAELDEEMKLVHSVKQSNPEYTLGGNRYQYKKKFKDNSGSNYIYAKTLDDMKKLIQNHLEEYNKQKASTYGDFARGLRDAIQLHSEEKLRTLASDFNNNDNKYIMYMFKRYIYGGWKLISNDLMVANGIFLFQKGDTIELVMLDTHNPYREFRFDHGKTNRKYTSIFGNFLADSEDVDNRWNLHAYYGNFLMMKGLTFLSQHPELFVGVKLGRVATMNLGGRGFMEESNEKLVKNFERWCALYQKKTGEQMNVLVLGEHVLPDSVAYAHIAMDLLNRWADNSERAVLLNDAFKDMQNRVAYSLDDIKQMIIAVKNIQGSKSYTAETTDWDKATRQALNYLNRAFLAMLGYQISAEARTGRWSQGSLDISGLNMRPFSRSASAIGRTLHEAYFSFVRVCQNEFVRYTSKWKLLIEKLYEENGHDKNWGGAWDFFERFFEHDGNEIDSRFLLKERGTMSTSTENQVLDMMYDAIERFKYRNRETEIEHAKDNDTYREVPLIKSKFNEKSTRIGRWKALLEEAKKDWNVMRDLLLDVDVNEDALRNIDNLDEIEIPAYVLMDDPKRDEKLRDNLKNYTTDLDFIFNLICQQGIRREASPQMMMIASAIRGGMSFMKWSGNDELDNVSQTVNDYVQSKLLSRPIHDRKLDTLMSTINIIKGIVSTATLGVNFKSFTRETITGFYHGFEKVMIQPQLKSKIDLKHYVSAIEEIIKHCYENNDVMSWHMQLNQIYGTANFSYNQMSESSTVEQYAVRNLQLSDLFFTTTWPDFIHRNAIIIAHLKTIGAYDAYSMKDGILTYDMDLDPRFELLRKYKTREECPLGLIKKWNEVYDLYKDNFDSWKNNGYKKLDGSEFKFGDKLPQALSPRQVSGLKDIADAMYGNYDEETKSLMTKMLLGSLFLQFKTYGINRLQEFFDGETDTSDIYWITHKIKNKNGELEDAWIVFDRNSTLLGGDGEFAKLVPESEVPLELIKSGAATKARTLSSFHINGGYVKQMIDLGASLFLYRNQEEFNKMWNENPTYKANLTIFMIDTLGMLLLAFLINLIYGEAMQGDYDSADWFTKWSYNVAIGVTQDGPVWSVLSSVVGDGTPPVLSVIQSWSNNVWSVVTGKQNLLYGVASSFGATRELAYIFSNVI